MIIWRRGALAVSNRDDRAGGRIEERWQTNFTRKKRTIWGSTALWSGSSSFLLIPLVVLKREGFVRERMRCSMRVRCLPAAVVGANLRSNRSDCVVLAVRLRHSEKRVWSQGVLLILESLLGW